MQHLALIEKTQSLIAAGDIVGAESALVELADREGDGALMEVLEQLPPKDVLAVIREYDSSRASIINLMLTPEQFARAVVIEKQYRDLTRSHLRGMMNSVIFRDGADPLLIKNAMHHASITSSQTYTQPTTAQMRQSLRDLEARLRLQHADDSHDL